MPLPLLALGAMAAGRVIAPRVAAGLAGRAAAGGAARSAGGGMSAAAAGKVAAFGGRALAYNAVGNALTHGAGGGQPQSPQPTGPAMVPFPSMGMLQDGQFNGYY